MSRTALDRYQQEMETAYDTEDEYVIHRLEQLWDVAADRLNAEYVGDINALTMREYGEAIAAMIDWSIP